MIDEKIPRLPSQEAALRIAQGDLGAVAPAVGWTLFRAALISAGVYAAGVRRRRWLLASLYGALAVEVYVLLEAAYHVRKAGETKL